MDLSGFDPVAIFKKNVALKGLPTSRSDLQELGDKLDLETDCTWLIEDVAKPQIGAEPAQMRWLVDCVRKARQVEHFKALISPLAFHVHLTAPEALLRARYDARLAAGGEYAGNVPYEIAWAHPNEASARSLIGIANLIVDVADKSADLVAEEILEGWLLRRR